MLISLHKILTMFSLLVFNTEIIIKVNKWFNSIKNTLLFFLKKTEDKEIQMVNVIKDKQSR